MTSELIRKTINMCLLGIVLFCTAFASAFAQSPSHAYINQSRSSTVSNYFVSIGAEGEFGLFAAKEKVVDEQGAEATEVIKRKWQGYGIRNEVGIEFLKFLQFNIGHTTVNLRSKESSAETISGSRINGGAALVFYAPLGNLRMGGGFLGSRMDYRKKSESSGYYGSGYYYDLGYNYFVSYAVSFYATVKYNFENLVRNSGKELPSTIKSETNTLGLGFKIWL